MSWELEAYDIELMSQKHYGRIFNIQGYKAVSASGKKPGHTKPTEGKLKADLEEARAIPRSRLIELINVMSVADFAATAYNFDSEVVLEGLVDAVDPERKLDAAGDLKVGRGLISQITEKYTDEMCKWGSNPVNRPGKEKSPSPCFKEHADIVALAKLVHEEMDILKEMDRKQFPAAPPARIDAKTLETFNEALKDAQLRAATERKLAIAELQKALTILTRARTRTLVSDYVNTKEDTITRYSEYLKPPTNIGWSDLFLMLESIAKTLQTQQTYTFGDSELLKESLLVLPLSQRTNEITPAELAWLRADGTWPVLEETVMKFVVRVAGKGNEKIHPLKLSRILSEAGVKLFATLGEELVLLRRDLFDTMRAQLRPTSNWYKRMTFMEEKLEKLKKDNELFDKFVERATIDAPIFPNDILVHILNAIVPRKYEALEVTLFYQNELVDDINGLSEIRHDRGIVALDLRHPAGKQADRLIMLKKKQMELIGESGKGIAELYNNALPLMHNKLTSDEVTLQIIKESLLGMTTNVFSPGAEALLGVNPASGPQWFSLKGHLDDDSSFPMPRLADIREDKQRIDAARKSWYAASLGVTKVKDYTPELKGYLQISSSAPIAPQGMTMNQGEQTDTTSSKERNSRLPLLDRVRADVEIATILRNSLNDAMKQGAESIKEKIADSKIFEIKKSLDEDKGPQKHLRENFIRISSKVDEATTKIIKSINAEVFKIFDVIDGVLPLRSQTLDAAEYLESLMSEAAIDRTLWFVNLRLASPTLSSRATSEMLLHQLYAVDYVIEKHELAKKAHLYLAAWEDIAERLKIGTKEEWKEIRALKNLAKDWMQSIQPSDLKINEVISNIETVVKDTELYLNDMKSTILDTNTASPAAWTDQQKLAGWNELSQRRSSLFLLKAVFEYFSNHAIIGQEWSKKVKAQVIAGIDRELKTIEEIRTFMKTQYPSTGEEPEDYEEAVNEKEEIAEWATYVTSFEGKPSRWWYQFPEESGLSGAIISAEKGQQADEEAVIENEEETEGEDEEDEEEEEEEALSEVQEDDEAPEEEALSEIAEAEEEAEEDEK